MNAKLYLLSRDEHKENSVANSRGNGTGTADSWWLRDSFYSIASGNVFWFVRNVNGGGGVDGASGNVYYGVAPGFSISK